MGKWNVNTSKNLVNNLLEKGWLTKEEYEHAFTLIERGKFQKGIQYALKQAGIA